MVKLFLRTPHRDGHRHAGNYKLFNSPLLTPSGIRFSFLYPSHWTIESDVTGWDHSGFQVGINDRSLARGLIGFVRGGWLNIPPKMVFASIQVSQRMMGAWQDGTDVEADGQWYIIKDIRYLTCDDVVCEAKFATWVIGYGEVPPNRVVDRAVARYQADKETLFSSVRLHESGYHM